jgi:hypothetical protein
MMMMIMIMYGVEIDSVRASSAAPRNLARLGLLAYRMPKCSACRLNGGDIPCGRAGELCKALRPTHRLQAVALSLTFTHRAAADSSSRDHDARQAILRGEHLHSRAPSGCCRNPHPLAGAAHPPPPSVLCGNGTPGLLLREKCQLAARCPHRRPQPLPVGTIRRLWCT